MVRTGLVQWALATVVALATTASAQAQIIILKSDRASAAAARAKRWVRLHFSARRRAGGACWSAWIRSSRALVN
jgi:hypothetical protein